MFDSFSEDVFHFAMKNFLGLFMLFSTLLAGCNAASVQKSPTPVITAATFNLRLAPKPTSNMWPERKDAVGELIVAHNFDIVGTQEGYLHQLEDIAKTTGYKFAGVAREDGKTAGEYSAIFYNPDRLELLKSGDFWFAETPDKPVKGWDAACKRICTWGEFKDRRSGAEFFFFSLHFDHIGQVARSESAKLLTSKIKEIAGGENAVCVGDFNATPESEPMKIIFDDGLLFDSKTASQTRPYGPRGTFHAFTGVPTFDRIDYILTTKNVKPLSYAVVSDKITNFDAQKKSADGKIRVQYPSDHFPVVVRLLVK